MGFICELSKGAQTQRERSVMCLQHELGYYEAS